VERGNERREGNAAAVSLHDTVGVTTLGGSAAPAPGVPRVAAVDGLRRVDELADGTGGSVDAVTGAAIGSYRESRLNGSPWLWPSLPLSSTLPAMTPASELAKSYP
jgi:hypothetical protein